MPAAPLIKFPRAALQQLLTEITEVTVIWNSEPEPFLGQVNGKPGYWIELSVVATATKGIDEDRIAYDPVNDVNGTTQISYRIYTVHIRCRSFNKDLPAFDVIDQVRRGLRSLTGKDGLNDIGISYVDNGPTVDIPVEKDNRQTSESGVDVKLAWQVSCDPGDDDGTYIAKVATLGPDPPPGGLVP